MKQKTTVSFRTTCEKTQKAIKHKKVIKFQGNVNDTQLKHNNSIKPGIFAKLLEDKICKLLM